MKDGVASRTAAWVAAMRGLGSLLPREARLCEDRYGARFGGRGAEWLRRSAERHPRLAPAVAALALSPLVRDALWMQLRTRLLDDVLLDFARASGRQLLLLGAGYDARAWRFSRELQSSVVFEVDQLATQGRKRRILAEIGAPPTEVRFLPWDFERQPMAELPAKLLELGHDRERRTLTIWEGVVPYLSEAAIDGTVRAVRDLSAPGSTLAFTYFDLSHKPRWDAFLVARLGEPFRSGFDPAALPGWLEARGFRLWSDESQAESGRRLLTPHLAQKTEAARGRHLAVARAV